MAQTSPQDNALPVLGVSDFVAVLNQTLEYAYPSVIIQGELANFRISKNRWVYFDLKDEYSSVKFFGTVYQLPGPLEDGLVLQVRGQPKLHQQYGFSVNVQFMQPVGEGSLRRAAALLEAKLTAEGLFDPARKRMLPYPPRRIGLITSSESAAYADFIKIMKERWAGIEIELADVQVQGELAHQQIVGALEYFNAHAQPVDVIVITRGGGSAEDLAAFSTELVTRAVATSRIPTLVAIGHEVDLSLAELAADQRASTPSNAAQLLVPDKLHVLPQLQQVRKQLGDHLDKLLERKRELIREQANDMGNAWQRLYDNFIQDLKLKRYVLESLNPETALKRGYAIVRSAKGLVTSGKHLQKGETLQLQLIDAQVDTKVTKIRLQ